MSGRTGLTTLRGEQFNHDLGASGMRSTAKTGSKARGSRDDRNEDETSKSISHAAKLGIGCFERESTISDVVVSAAAKTRPPIFIPRYAASSAMLRRTYCRMPP